MADTISYSYQAPPGSGRGTLVRAADGAFIPCDLGNMDYQVFLAWLDEGNPAPEGWSGPVNAAPTVAA